MSDRLQKIILLSLGVVVLLACIWSVVSVFIPDRVKFILADDISSIRIDNQTINNGQSIVIKPGSYRYIPEGDGIDNSPINITIKNSDDVVEIKSPGLSPERLGQLLKSELSSILNVTNHKYSEILNTNNYKMGEVSLWGKGDIASVQLVPDDYSNRDPSGVYKAILKKSNSTWTVVGIPQLILTKFTTPGVDADLLDEINKSAL